MKKPPCKVNGVDCPRRYIGCQSECETYHEWLTVHAAEKETRTRYYARTYDADSMAKDVVHRFTKNNKHIKRKVGQR